MRPLSISSPYPEIRRIFIPLSEGEVAIRKFFIGGGLALGITFGACADEPHHHHDHSAHEAHLAARRGTAFQVPGDCSSPDEIWDPTVAMCMPFPGEAGLKHVMVHGNGFLVGITESGPRGRSAVAAPNMLMVNAGSTFFDGHFFNVGLMLTAEKWTFPAAGYPLLLQTGESDADGKPFIDAQHPHSSPLMGITFSDTISLGETSWAKVFFAPRGESTDGPIPFMHRATAVQNPDAPLGHHIGQDVGHISSTVFGGALRVGDLMIEVSGFNGTEPEPTAVDLPLGSPNSVSGRITGFFSNQVYVMGSLAYVNQTHHDQVISPTTNFDDAITKEWRYSVSGYTRHSVNFAQTDWKLYQTLMYAGVRTIGTDGGVESTRNSFTHEAVAKSPSWSLWTRTEVLQKVPAELMVSGVSDPTRGRWFGAVTLGVTFPCLEIKSSRLSVGISGTQYILPADYSGAYGGNPAAGKIFIQLAGMDMWLL